MMLLQGNEQDRMSFYAVNRKKCIKLKQINSKGE